MYESALVINGSDWYFVARAKDPANPSSAIKYGCWYSCSTNAGVTWSELAYIDDSIGSKPRGVVCDDKILFSIPAVNFAFRTSSLNDSDGIEVNGRHGTYILRGDANTPINEWEKVYYLTSKYGINYGELFTIDKDIYYAYSCDMVHLENKPIAGKSHIMLARCGNPDNMNLFGDY